MGRRGCYNRLLEMLEPAVRRAASGIHICYNLLGIKQRPMAFFCWKRAPPMLQPSLADATTINGESYKQRR